MSSPLKTKTLSLVGVLSILLLAIATTTGHPQQVPFLSPPTRSYSTGLNKPLKVAIIGGGPAGTSAGFFLSKFANASGNSIEVHIFERSDYLGGRSTIIHPFDSSEYPPVEAGASIFVPANKHLHQAVRDFNLTLEPPLSTSTDGQDQNYAIWDGTEFGFESSGRTWWDTIKLFWRYGKAPIQLNGIRQRSIDQFQSLYSNEFVRRGPFLDLNQWAIASGFEHLLSKTGSDYLINEENVNVQAVNELVAIMARTNYGQDISVMHGLGAMVSLAGTDGTSIRGGNRQIFQQFANHSNAQVHFNHQITAITERESKDETQNRQYILSYHQHQAEQDGEKMIGDSQAFDAVILAAPYDQASVTILSPSEPVRVPHQPFVQLHVTFIVTNATAPSGELFNRPVDQFMARSIYSTMMRNVIGKGKRPIFNSLNYLRNLGPKQDVIGDMYIVKVFSEAPLSTNTLSKLFGSMENLLWIKRIKWDAYPILTPLRIPTTYAPTKLDKAIYYVNGFESLISTMETQTVASWNIAMCLSQQFWNYVPQKSWAT
ncbi:hypothetical protein MJO28_001101 [Puccinia striiformis f. sp. tritici]|uniref:Uncharacterized protein n=1 Tax=Puccinia striiformis f. sp. tritici TaxID=168172 RepID=A0ACC0EZU8_9BASI|nr:hypothetical protein Pst134EB_001335 [Puccinia striiformis f. sp. tritici]KAI7963007.1 hypothetical protein MJO28_001101 [Puccinia striiformis f. sp. tritici]KAI7966871.1 hypothetical protein MJO29_000148 [Puccinia striiformis f. sp. tritici]KAI9607530.1 hypothetical protein KEM48_001540 [Puccinia striiformis f. sp. tritici PST-130]